ncbi:AQP3 [Cordylochernes scorpioides]|uniref:AQP3 n=1 Tax=Cordylochernes scorpioides TaxID=51811 RepID=A0ABY6JWC0_9ARAC|nr:AQP3 [Cordylochernes scorpioides]
MKKISQLKEDIHRSHLKISLAIVLVLKTDDIIRPAHYLCWAYAHIALRQNNNVWDYAAVPLWGYIRGVEPVDQKVPCQDRKLTIDVVLGATVELGGNAVLATVILSRSTLGPVAGPLGWGLALVVALYASGGVSGGPPCAGGHLNPAVSTALASVGKFPWRKVPQYAAAQYLGAFMASVVLYLLYIDVLSHFDNGMRAVPPAINATAQIFATYPQPYVSTGIGFLDQVVGTAALVLAICAITDDRNMAVPKGLVPLAIGLSLLLVQLVFGLNCMAAVNPARDLGPRIFTAIAGWGAEVFSFRDYNWFWVPVVAPHLGGVLGAWMYGGLVGLHWPEDGFDMENGGESVRMKRVSALDTNGGHKSTTISHH